MSKLVEDIKSGLKGVKGAGDALRGEAMDATDQAFDNNHGDPSVTASRTKNRTIAEKGKADMHQMDEDIASREWDRKRQHESAAVANNTQAMNYGAAPSSGLGPKTTHVGGVEQPPNRTMGGGRGYGV
ncbi:hypothetical protein HJFPF1_10906 [Paramyrothecium foliicola]|nr:hypothetical protein HJFPF1_10906 [Paramyrothecium foliicola]